MAHADVEAALSAGRMGVFLLGLSSATDLDGGTRSVSCCGHSYLDNHYNSSLPLKRTDLLYRSASRAGIPYRVGSLVPASERAWQAGDREQWPCKELEASWRSVD